MTAFFLTAGLSYLLGSIPFGYILVRTFRGQDIRQTGSGNIGATNVSRTSPGLGALTLLLDAFKGFAAVAITRMLFPGNNTLLGVAALFAIIGPYVPGMAAFSRRQGSGHRSGLLCRPRAQNHSGDDCYLRGDISGVSLRVSGLNPHRGFVPAPGLDSRTLPRYASDDLVDRRSFSSYRRQASREHPAACSPTPNPASSGGGR